ncbi:hypothetical protein CRE_22779 [Caenorhabditis remanei]|uniref:RecQ-mediated genome instability protein 1 n=1 Tax=Caenorhabditis remanei TaxID=31234 RepID=E3MHG3_CAERE|nr:hypothetical protein CRE_22779 [Caenorhabditis remanei]
MSPKCTFLFQYFNERHILLKDEWLNSVIEFLHQKLPSSRGFSDEKFANLVLDQWTCSHIENTSFPVFGNHGIDANVAKQRLQGPIVCQINGFIDTGSPYYQQYCNLSGRNGKKEDNSGFERVFHEKEDDSDQKPSRLLKLSLTDGESSLHAIEFWKCPQLSLHLKPGTKLLIEPPCDIRKGNFLLKPNNFKILGGEVLPLLNSYLPVEQYARKLKIQKGAEPIQNQNPPTSSGPSAMISRYFQKKPAPCTPSTSRAPEPREISPDVMAYADNDEEENVPESDMDSDFVFIAQKRCQRAPANFLTSPISDYENRKSSPRKSPRKSSDAVLVSSLIRQIQDSDDENFETSRRRIPRMKSPPKKRNSWTTTPPTADIPKTPPTPFNFSQFQTRRSSCLLTSRRVDPMDEILENMIEKGEEPISYAKSSPIINPFRVKTQPPPAKKVKMEVESDDDDIQIIELVTPPAPIVKIERKSSILGEKIDKNEEKEEYSPEERAALQAFNALKLSSLTESIKKMKYSIGSKRFVLLAFIVEFVEPLRVIDGLWTMKVQLRDDSGETEALIDNRTLERLIGYTCEEAMAVRKSSDLEKRKDGKRRLEALEQQLERLDLIFEIFRSKNSVSSDFSSENYEIPLKFRQKYENIAIFNTFSSEKQRQNLEFFKVSSPKTEF